jgi:23S rRNA (uracil1939-C5)-methyltransferase
MPEIYTVTPSAYAFGGETIARLPDGRAVFVPFAIPGERLRVELVEEKRGFARARLLEVLEPSPERIAPRCLHFEECGGCHYQHLTYDAQLAVKTAILKDQLERIGKLASPTISTVSPSPNEFNYRNHVQFHLAPDGKPGYHKARSDEVFAIRECHLPEPPLNALWPLLELEQSAAIERIGLRLGSDGDLQVILESPDPQPPELSVEDLPVSVAHLSPAGTLVLAGDPGVTIEVLGRGFQVSAGTFFQANTAVAGMMAVKVVALLESRLGLHGAATAIDAYCGAGLFSAFLAPRVGRLIGIESSPSAVEDFTANLDEFDNVEIYEAPVERVLPELDVKPDFILVDPPRAGLERRALDGLLSLAPPLLVYVSCDPATLARDAGRLAAGGYRLEEISLFDQFPQTYHIESISVWTQ